jgi:Spy/CpxP family protein refolding chaperone
MRTPRAGRDLEDAPANGSTNPDREVNVMMNTRTMSVFAVLLTLGMGLSGLAGVVRAQAPPPPPEPGSAAWDHGSMGPGGPGMRGPGLRGAEMRERHGAMMRELDLTKEQRDKVADLREKQERAAIRMRADLQTARLDLRRLMRADKPDRAAIDRQIDRMAQLGADMRKARVGMMLDVRALLTPEQRERARDHMGR